MFSLAITFYSSNLAQALVVKGFEPTTTDLIIAKSLPHTECEKQVENFVVKYSAPTVSITVQQLKLIWNQRIESYENPISATPSQVTTQIKSKKLTNYQLDKLKNLIKSSGFMNLAPEYGAATGQRYYPYSISVCLDNQEKKVFLRSNPSSGKSPEAFRVVEDYLQQLIK
ncbi:MAG: hypothetical protein V7K47_25605 [Nostoc sp.]